MHNSNTENVKFIHEIKLQGDDNFCKAFNKCSDLWSKTDDPNLSKEERIEAIKDWQDERMLLELGFYN